MEETSKCVCIKPTTTNTTTAPASEEANIIETGGNSAGNSWTRTHTGLIDNQGLAGTTQDVDGKVKCGVSLRGSSSVPPYFSLKLAKASRVVKLQLAFRTDHATGQGKNVMVQVGTSPQYNANDPICTEIPQLSGTGLVDYDCNQFHTGQYVIISTDQSVLTICEAKVFVAEAECFSEVGFDYPGNDVSYTDGLTSDTSVDDCRQFCRTDCAESCKFFTHTKSGGCWCKNGNQGRTPHNLGNDITSGEVC